ncbi:hypothetical protein [Persephonella sp. KM09-Lau-8]|uniref:hypothetical protein n=1 Tax=Persephonella sp. KM09-Lau-8 TaxID=1158345 RepID=UPI000497A997|nr:hypothetical protein [Persephonella sp. KM09-Lau-8]
MQKSFLKQFLLSLDDESLEYLTNVLVDLSEYGWTIFDSTKVMSHLFSDINVTMSAIDEIIALNNPKYENLFRALLNYFITKFSEEDFELVFDYLMDKYFELEKNRYEVVDVILTLIHLEESNIVMFKDHFYELVEAAYQDKETKVLRYYEFLNFYVSYDVVEAREFLEKLKEKYPDEDLLYEIEGHIAMNIVDNDYKLAMKAFQNVAEWIMFRVSMDYPKDNLNSNMLFFLSAYAELLISSNDIEKAQKIIDIASSIVDTVAKNEFENLRDTDAFQVMVSYTEYFLYVNIQLLKHTQPELSDKEAYEKSVNKLKEISPFLYDKIQDYIDFDDVLNSAYFETEEK